MVEQGHGSARVLGKRGEGRAAPLATHVRVVNAGTRPP